MNFVPHPVISGFTSAGGLIIAMSQLKDVPAPHPPLSSSFLFCPLLSSSFLFFPLLSSPSSRASSSLPPLLSIDSRLSFLSLLSLLLSSLSPLFPSPLSPQETARVHTKGRLQSEGLRCEGRVCRARGGCALGGLRVQSQGACDGVHGGVHGRSWAIRSTRRSCRPGQSPIRLRVPATPKRVRTQGMLLRTQGVLLRMWGYAATDEGVWCYQDLRLLHAAAQDPRDHLRHGRGPRPPRCTPSTRACLSLHTRVALAAHACVCARKRAGADGEGVADGVRVPVGGAQAGAGQAHLLPQ
eukprot:116487-Rhodomonas_salina.1